MITIYQSTLQKLQIFENTLESFLKPPSNNHKNNIYMMMQSESVNETMSAQNGGNKNTVNKCIISSVKI